MAGGGSGDTLAKAGVVTSSGPTQQDRKKQSRISNKTEKTRKCLIGFRSETSNVIFSRNTLSK